MGKQRGEPRLPLRVLWHSNAPWSSTGYGQQTAIWAERLAPRVQSLAISAFYGLHGGRLNWNGIPVLPPGFDAYGSDIIQDHAEAAFGAIDGGLVVSLTDCWVLDASKWKALKVAAWTPVDHDPLMPPTTKWLRDTGAVPLAMSRFGQRMFEDEGFQTIYVPHGIDTKVYSPRDRAKSRAMLNVSESQFLVGMVAANISKPSRKSYPEAFRAFATFARKHPEAVLYVHAHPFDRRGFNLPELAKSAGIPERQVRFSDPYVYMMTPDPETLSHAYSAMDVLLMPSNGEGFGLPLIEAQSCGTPAIVTDFSAQPELLGAGWKVDGQSVYTGLRSWQVIPNIASIEHALERSFVEAEGLREQARSFALAYDADKVLVDHWLPALATLKDWLDL